MQRCTCGPARGFPRWRVCGLVSVRSDDNTASMNHERSRQDAQHASHGHSEPPTGSGGCDSFASSAPPSTRRHPTRTVSLRVARYIYHEHVGGGACGRVPPPSTSGEGLFPAAPRRSRIAGGVPPPPSPLPSPPSLRSTGGVPPPSAVGALLLEEVVVAEEVAEPLEAPDESLDRPMRIFGALTE